MALGWGVSEWSTSPWGSAFIVDTHVYARQIASAIRMIAKKGQLVIWIKQNQIQDVPQPWKATAPGSPPTYPVSILFLPPGGGLTSQLRSLMLAEGTSVPKGSLRGLMGAVSFVPAVNDRIQRGTDTLMIKTIDPIAPNGEVILYKFSFA